jgi:hypothetical protein
MAVTIDEVSAEVSAPESRGQAAPAGSSQQPPSPSEMRRQREQLERMQQRACRIAAD